MEKTSAERLGSALAGGGSMSSASSVASMGLEGLHTASKASLEGERDKEDLTSGHGGGLPW